MRFEVLRPLRVVFDDAREPLVFTAERPRVLLAVLLRHANQPVPVDGLCEMLWGGAPPKDAHGALRALVVRLRRALGPQVGARLETRTRGYMITLSDDELDAAMFEALCQCTVAAVRAGRWSEASSAGAQALGLWQGKPLADVPCQTLRDEWLPSLEQTRIQVLESRIEADLHSERPDRVADELRSLIRDYPLRERFRVQLMAALAGAGRRAEALEAYRDARSVLLDELGIEPGPELQRLQQRILAGDGELLGPDPGASPAARDVVPRQLLAAPGHFTGRGEELRSLIEWTGEVGAPGGTVVISAIDGMAGIGKTALALHAAHQLAEKFPGGQLFIDLHGYTKGYPPREPDQALEWLLRTLGVGAQQIPEETEARAALYRQRLADTRTLIVLDNALDEAQVRPLLPGHAGCLVLITSRRRLKGLDDALSLPLDPLPAPDALALLTAVAGPDRVPDGDPLAGEIAESCGRLPLALRIAGALLRHRPAWPLEHFAGLMRDRRGRVTALSDGDRDLAGVFDLSYTGLGEQRQLLFRRVGLLPGPDTDAYAAAALLKATPGTATRLLEDLVDHNLLINHAPGRYRLHDLLRDHARALAADDPEPDRVSALDRLLYYYAHTAQSASIPMARYPRPAPAGPTPAHTPDVTEQDAARTWLRVEQPNLEAAFAQARTYGLDEHTIALAAGLAETLQAEGPFTRALEIHKAAAEAAERLDHPAAHATALTDLARVQQVAGDLPGADDALTRALEIHHTLDHRLGEANALTDLGRMRHLAGDYPGAVDAQTRALEIYLALGHRLGEANALTDLGRVRQATGNRPGADDALNPALEIYRSLGHRDGEANALTYLGRMRYMAGDYAIADDAHTRALEIYRGLSNRNGEANALTDVGRVRQATGDYPGAVDALTRALEIYRTLGNRLGEAYALTDLGRMWHMTGDYPAAGDAHTGAVEIYRMLGNRYGEAYALTNLGHARYLTGDLPGAVNALTPALEIYRALGDRSNEAWALNYYAATLAATGQRPRALELYQQALAMNRELSKPDDEALSLEGIAEHHLATGNPTEGATYLRLALEIYQRLGMIPDTRRIQDRLDGLTTR